jgi:hypothetical protein
MTLAPAASTESRFQRRTLLTLDLFAVAAAYTIYVVATRYESNRALERRVAQQAAAKGTANDRATVKQLGGAELAIRALYAWWPPPSFIAANPRSFATTVSNAKTVTLDLPSGEVWPSHYRCLDISPKKTTTYTLTITSPAGPSISQSVQVTVH